MTSTNNIPTIYIRCRRQHQTIFMHCKSNELLSDIIYRIAALVYKQPNQIRLYMHFNTVEDKNKAIQEYKTLIDNENKLKNKNKKLNDNWFNKTNNNVDVNNNINNVNDNDIILPPLDENKKLRELNIHNDTLLDFIVQKDNGEWENVPDNV